MNTVKRVSLMIGEDQHKKLRDLGLNVSGLVRDLITDYLSEHRITLSVTEETKTIYQKIVANSGAQDEGLEPYLQEALHKLLKQRIRELSELNEHLNKKGEN
jgi:post-segregation antitoxin (ccd killing protein)